MTLTLKVFFMLLFVWTLSPAEVTSVDSDGDGVNDFRDNCLDTPKGYFVDTQGCENFLILHPDFSKNSISVSDGIGKEIAILVEFLKNRPQMSIRITGHSSRTAVSGDVYNLKLSKKRAEMLKHELVKRGIASKRIETIGKGFHEPMFSNETQEGRNKNRRLEIEFFEEE